MAERLQKILAQWGIASRRKAEEMIRDGRVEVNGTLAILGQQADPEVDAIAVDSVAITRAQRPQHCYILLHKPRGIVCTCDDPEGRPTVLSLLSPELNRQQGIHPVGRLDTYSTGALLMTNDGSLTYRMTHPRHEVSKVYRVTVSGHPSDRTLQHWRNGVNLEGQPTIPASVKRLDQSSDSTTLEVILREGRNRQIRRVAELLGHPVKRLHRLAIGNIQLGSLTPGEYRLLSPNELAHLVIAEPRPS
jgi:pseudouridine synthase